jgi:uncharacterized membrane protein YfcA
MIETVVLVTLGFLFGGMLKGATGVGAPLIAVPLLTMFYDVQTAVVLFAVPNAATNLWQCWKYRQHRLEARFLSRMFIAGATGTLVGTFLLINLPAKLLTITLAVSVFGYVAFRWFNPDWKMSMPLAHKLVIPVASVAGTLQASSGISAPVSVSFLNAMKMDRPQFISTISIYFLSISFVQLPAMFAFGLMTREYFMISVASLLPLFAGMPLGAMLTRHLSKEHFDTLILVVLSAVATGLLLNLR